MKSITESAASKYWLPCFCNLSVYFLSSLCYKYIQLKRTRKKERGEGGGGGGVVASN